MKFNYTILSIFLFFCLILSACQPSSIPTQSSSGNKSEDDISQYYYEAVTWGLTSKELEDRPGWKEYEFQLAFLSTSPDTPRKLIPIDSRAEVVTEDNNRYEGIMIYLHVSDFSTHTEQWSQGNVYVSPSDNILLPPGYFLAGRNGTVNSYQQYGGRFAVPSTLIPKYFYLENVAPIDLTAIPATKPAQSYLVEKAHSYAELPYQEPEGAIARLTLSNPRIIDNFNDNTPALVVDVDLFNADLTADQTTKIEFYVFDSDGMFYENTYMGCDQGERDYNIKNDGSALVGPGQTLQGVFCIPLPYISNQALMSDFVLSGYKDSINHPLLFKINAVNK